MSDEYLNQIINTLISQRFIVAKLVDEIQRLRKLVQCCPMDNDYDGNCRIHSGRAAVERV